MTAFRFAMRNKLPREISPLAMETIENELEYLWAALKAVNESIDTTSGATVDLSDYVTGPVPGVSVQDEIVLWSGVTGRVLKRASGTGVVHATSGVYGVGLVNLASEVSGLLPLANLSLDGNATHLLFGDGTMRAIVKADISDFAHRLLSAEHSDTTPETPEPGAIIVGVAGGETIDAELYWIDGGPVPTVSSLADLGADEYWIDGGPLASIGFSSEGKWAKLAPPAHANMILKWDGTALGWIDYP